MTPAEDIKVVVKADNGMYLATTPDGLGLSNEVYGAVLFDYVDDKVEEKIIQLRQRHGIILQAVPLKMEDVLETCDQCDEKLVPLKAFFDGTQFLCPKCRAG
ncbi:MAG TPA: hypothetical protein VG146_21840 [Verrucomicrobiae bacterium]|nr:hypothetical protein [Verrucomicrobiae bacterium]